MAPRLTIEPFPPDLKRKFKAQAAQLGLSMSQAAQLAVSRWVKSYRDDPDLGLEAEPVITMRVASADEYTSDLLGHGVVEDDSWPPAS